MKVFYVSTKRFSQKCPFHVQICRQSFWNNSKTTFALTITVNEREETRECAVIFAYLFSTKYFICNEIYIFFSDIFQSLDVFRQPIFKNSMSTLFWGVNGNPVEVTIFVNTGSANTNTKLFFSYFGVWKSVFSYI